MKKKVLSLLLAVCLIVGMLPLAASAAETPVEDPATIGISPANLVDADGVKTLYDSYKVTATQDTDTNSVTVKVLAEGLKKHAMTGEEEEDVPAKTIAYWCGFSLIPTGGKAGEVQQMKVVSGTSVDDVNTKFETASAMPVWKNVTADSKSGLVQYYDAKSDTKIRYYKLQWLGADGAEIAEYKPTTYTIDISGVSTADSDTTDNVEAAMLDDQRTPDGVDEGLAETYEITSVAEKLDTNYGGYYTDVAVNVKGLKEHQNGDTPQTMGYWAGIAVLAPEDAANVKYAFERSFADLNKASLKETTVDAVNASEEKGLAAYANLGDQSPKTWLKVQWLDKSNNALNTTVYHIDFTGYTLAQPEKNPAPEALTVDNANLEDHSEGGALVAQNQITTGFKTVQGAPVWDSTKNVWYFPITVTADTLKIHTNGDQQKTVGYWIGPAIQAPEGIEATDQIKVKTGASMADLDIASDAQASTVEEIHDGVYGVALYTNVTEANTDVVRWMRVQWIDVSEGNKVVRDDIFQITHNVATLETVGLKSVTVYDSTGDTLEDGVTAAVEGTTVTLSGVAPQSETTYTLKYTTTAGGAGETTVTYNSGITAGETFKVLGIDYTVVAAFADMPQNVAVAEPAKPVVNAGADIPEQVKTSAGTTEVSGMQAAAANVAADDTAFNAEAVKEAGKAALEADDEITFNPGSDTVNIYVQPYLDVIAESYDEVAGTMVVDITPKYRVIASTANDFSNVDLDGTSAKNAVVLDAYKGDLNLKNVQVSITLPSGFAQDGDLYVKHYEHFHKANVQTNAATFTTESFSSFTFTKEQPEASIGDIYYATLQEAVDAVENGGVINVLTAGLTATVSRVVAFKTTGETATINAGTGYKDQGTGTQGTVTEYKFVRVGGGSTGGGGTGSTGYTVTVSATQNGTVTASPSSANKGDKVTLTVAPAEGYELGTLTVKDASGKTVSTTKVSENEYTFTMPEGNVTVTATFVEKNATPFTDVKTTDWWYEAVKYVYENKLMAGTSDTTFEPTAKLNRAQAVQILYNLEGQPAVTGTADFTDVSGHWALNAITWGAKNGVVAGVGNGKFDPNANVTREQFAQMMYNYAKFKGYDLTAQGDLDNFSDSSKVSDWAETALAWANGEGLINGNTDGTLAPNGTAIRGQAASIMAKFDQNVAEE